MDVMVSPPQEGESKRVAAEERLAACTGRLEDMGASFKVQRRIEGSFLSFLSVVTMNFLLGNSTWAHTHAQTPSGGVGGGAAAFSQPAAFF